jgi:hypothetical protein
VRSVALEFGASKQLALGIAVGLGFGLPIVGGAYILTPVQANSVRKKLQSHLARAIRSHSRETKASPVA